MTKITGEAMQDLQQERLNYYLFMRSNSKKCPKDNKSAQKQDHVKTKQKTKHEKINKKIGQTR